MGLRSLGSSPFNKPKSISQCSLLYHSKNPETSTHLQPTSPFTPLIGDRCRLPADHRGPVLASMSPHRTPSSHFILTRRTHRYPVQRERERERGGEIEIEEQERGRSPISRQQKQQVAVTMDSDNRFSGKTYRRSRRPT
ncbi:hypothetical protein Hanom_Chr15g01397851 [Helianthus anomalus]